MFTVIICSLITTLQYCEKDNDSNITSVQWNITDGNCVSRYKNRKDEIETFQHNLTCLANEDCYDPTMICPEGNNICNCALYHVWVPEFCTCVANLEEIRSALKSGVDPDGAVFKVVGATLYKWLAYEQEDDTGFLSYLKATWPIIMSVILVIIFYIIIYIL